MKTHIAYHIENNELIIDNLYVNPRSRGKGKGYELLDKAKAYAERKGIKVMSLCAYPQDNTVSKQFLKDYYECYGFEDHDGYGIMDKEI